MVILTPGCMQHKRLYQNWNNGQWCMMMATGSFNSSIHSWIAMHNNNNNSLVVSLYPLKIPKSLITIQEKMLVSSSSSSVSSISLSFQSFLLFLSLFSLFLSFSLQSFRIGLVPKYIYIYIYIYISIVTTTQLVII